MPTYHELTLRNSGYLTDEVQEKIRATRLLVAGCGIGSTFAEAALRLGFEHLILADGDTVAAHNLNRQNFVAGDIGEPKVRALARRLRAINPAADIREVDACLNPANAAQWVAQSDLVFDNIDFLDLAAVVGLHDACRRLSKPAITAWGLGWGAACLYFPIGGTCSLRTLLGLQENQAVHNESYAATLAPLLARLAGHLDADVIAVSRQALAVMEDGTPCPASQVSPGAYAVGALGGTLAVRVVAGLPVLPAPRLLLADMPMVLTTAAIDLCE